MIAITPTLQNEKMHLSKKKKVKEWEEMSSLEISLTSQPLLNHSQPPATVAGFS
jgi:hypothetical protein